MLILMSPREARVIRNEALFREVNFRIADLGGVALSPAEDGLLSLVCECAELGCVLPIEVDSATFQQVRENALWFLVAPGHEHLDVESVVERGAGYLVVEKHST
jgi:hypothetical protein